MYKAQHYCEKCDAALTFYEVMMSHGVCPYCGNISGGTVVDYVKKSVLVHPAQQKKKKWWQFWK